MHPTVSVIMSVHNGDSYVMEAIDGILSQTWEDFEFIVTDDASTDASGEILRSYQDARLKIVTNPENIGLTKSLNRMLALAQGEFIARQDADDLSFPIRLKAQVDHLRANPELLAVGTQSLVGPTLADAHTIFLPLHPDHIQFRLCANNALMHGSVMFRRSALQQCGAYDENFRFGQDYDLWMRFSEAGDLENITTLTYFWRSHADQISETHRHHHDQIRGKIQGLAWERRFHGCDALGRLIVPTSNHEAELKRRFLWALGAFVFKPDQFDHAKDSWLATKTAGTAPRDMLNATLTHLLCEPYEVLNKISTALGIMGENHLRVTFEDQHRMSHVGITTAIPPRKQAENIPHPASATGKSVVLVYPAFSTDHKLIHHGLAAISGYLKARGIGVELVIVDSDDPSRFAEMILSHSPLWIGFTVIQNYWGIICRLARELRGRSSTPIIVGGKGIVSAPELFEQEPSLDLLCLHEGEDVCFELSQRLLANSPAIDITGTWAREADGSIRKNPLRPLVEDLDSLGMPDYEIFGKDIFSRYQCFSFSRGCPYSCAHCVNSALRRLFATAVRKVRRKSVDKAIAEIKHYVTMYGADFLAFDDETLLSDKDWLRQFLAHYRQEIGLPFHGQTRPETLDHESAQLLAYSGCRFINIGLESGNEGIRRRLLHRWIPNPAILNAFHAAHEAGLRPVSFNMLALPGESFNLFKETIDLNWQVLPANTQLSIYYPYSGTLLGNACRRKNRIAATPCYDFFSQSILSLKHFSPDEIDQAKALFEICSVAWYAANDPSLSLDFHNRRRTPTHAKNLLLCSYATSTQDFPCLYRSASASLYSWGGSIPHLLIVPPDLAVEARRYFARFPHLTLLSPGAAPPLLPDGIQGEETILCILAPCEWINPEIRFHLPDCGDVFDIAYAAELFFSQANKVSSISTPQNGPPLFPLVKVPIKDLLTWTTAHEARDHLSRSLIQQKKPLLKELNSPPLFISDSSLLLFKHSQAPNIDPWELRRRASSSHEAALLESYFEQFFLALVRRLRDPSAFALYGGGNHTKWLLPILRRLALSPLVIFDDNPGACSLGRQCATLDKLASYQLEAVVISNDTCHLQMWEKLKSQIGTRAIEAINPYAYLPHAPYSKK